MLTIAETHLLHAQRALEEIAAAPQPIAGDILGPYEVLGLIERGGMANVYHARDRYAGEDIALKVLHPTLPPELLQHEASILQHVRHGNIVRPHGQGYTRWIGLALEHLPISYRYVCEDPSYVRLAKYLIDIASGLSYLHARGLVHRDVKPNNTCGREEGGEVIFRLIDFNRAMVTNSSYRLKEGMQYGTPRYCPSRRELQQHGVTTAFDIYSIGKTIAHIVLEMHDPDGERLCRLFQRSDERILLTIAKLGVPEELYSLTQDCLSQNPRERPRAIEIVERSFQLLDSLTLDALQRGFPRASPA